MELWGLFGTLHLLSLLLAAGIIVGLYYLLKGRSERLQRTVLLVLSLSGMAAIVFNLVAWGSPWEYLPLHLCSINAVLLPIAILTKSKAVGNMLLVWCLGALAAITMQFYAASWGDFGKPVFWFFYLPHVFEFGIPLLLFKLGLVKKELRFLPSTLALTGGIYTLVHLANRLLNPYFVKAGITDAAGEIISVNYMYSIAPETPILEFFWKLIPHSFWYMILIFPILGAYLAIVYLPQIKAAVGATRRNDHVSP